MYGYLLILPFLIFTQMIISYFHTDLTDLTDFAPSELMRTGGDTGEYRLTSSVRSVRSV